MIKKEMQDILVPYNKGLELYKSRKFKEALLEFKEGLKFIPEDGPTKMYILRCEKYIDHPPLDDWDGVFIMKTK